MIDLETARRPLHELIKKSLSSFAAEQPHVTWSTLALYACPWAGWIMTHLDTEANSDATVAAFEDQGPDWYGEDQWGRFNNNCPDFEFFEWRELQVKHWRTEYEETDPIHVRDLSGRDHHIGTENEAINGLVFEFLRAVLLEYVDTVKADPLMLQSRRRFGVQLLGSAFSEFWCGPG